MRSRVRVGLVLALALAVALAAGVVSVATRPRRDRSAVARAPELHSEWSYDAASKTIAFANDSGSPGLFLFDTKTGGLRELPVTQPWPYRPVLAPFGRRLLFHDRNILTEDRAVHRAYLMDVATGDVTLALETGENARIFNEAFSPDGQRIAYELYAERGPGDVTSNIRVVTLASGSDDDTGAEGHAPRWSSDGNRLYFSSGGCAKRLALAERRVETLFCVDGRIEDSGVVVSPDERWIAATVSLGPCTHLVVTGTLNPAPRELDGTECAYRPTWLPGPPGRLAFLMPKNGSRLAFVRSIDDSSPAKAWDDRPGVTYQIAAAIDGGLFELRAEPGAPRSIWHVSAVGSNDRKLLFAPLSADVVRRVAPRVEQVSVRAADGLDVPLVLFQPATTGPTTRSPVVVWVHGGRDAGGDISPRWYNEIAYLTAAGAVVVAVNYRGSTGYGGAFRARAAERDAQVTDLYAAADYARRLPGVDPSRLFWFAESAAGALVGRAAGAAEAEAANVGFVQWTGADLAASAEALPGGASLLWIRGRWDAAAPTFANLEARLRARAVRFDVLSFARESHALYWGDDRAAALERVRSFVGL